MPVMDDHMDCAPETCPGPVKRRLTSPLCDVDTLDDGMSINAFIDNKIKDLSSEDVEEPFLVADLDSVVKRHLRWLANLPRVKPFYAVKCNCMPAVVGMLHALGTGFDCASKGEIQLALSLGISPDKIIFAHTTKPPAHIKYARSRGINMMTFDCEEELLKISRCHGNAKLVLRIAVDDSTSLLKLNSKFGAKMAAVGKLLQCAAELGLNVIGVSFHVGSGCTDSTAFRQAIADARHVFDVANFLGFEMSILDIGGGFSGRDDFQVKFEDFAEVINGALDEFFPADSGVQVIAEPGRYYVESAFTLAASVIAKRAVVQTQDENYDEINSSDKVMMYYLNDGVYGSLSCLMNDAAHSEVEPYLHRDKITDRYRYPELHVGDWLLVDHMGAYTVSLCTDFNGFEHARIYPVVTAQTWHALNLSNT
ncbi:uncharacterized protein V6R79_002578 [Siganus canaliculatus]